MDALTWHPKKPSSRLRKKTSEDDLEPDLEDSDDDNDEDEDEVRPGRDDPRKDDDECEKSEFDVRSF